MEGMVGGRAVDVMLLREAHVVSKGTRELGVSVAHAHRSTDVGVLPVAIPIVEAAEDHVRVPGVRVVGGLSIHCGRSLQQAVLVVQGQFSKRQASEREKQNVSFDLQE